MTDSELLDRVRAANPVADPEALSEADRAAAARVLAAALAADAAQPSPLQRRAARTRRRWIVAPVGAAVAVGAALVIALTSGVDSGDVQPPRSLAARALDRAARAAQDSGEAVGDLKPGQYLYVRERNVYMSTSMDLKPGPFTTFVPHVRETWTNRAGDGEFVESSGRSAFAGPRDRARWVAAGRPPVDGAPTPPGAAAPTAIHGLYFANEKVTYEQLSEKPTDGYAMYRELKRAAHGAGPSPDQEVFVSVGDLLRTEPVPAKIRAALYRALAYVKGIRFAGEIRDPEGRRGLAVELTGDDGTVHQLVFDPDTSRVLSEQDVIERPVDYADVKPGTPVGYRVVLQAVPVDHLGERP